MTQGTVYLHDEPAALRFEIRGRLDEGLIRQVEALAATAASIRRGRDWVLDFRRADSVEPGAAAQMASHIGSGLRLLVREDQFEPLAAATPRPPRLMPQEGVSPLRRLWCKVLERVLPHCACRSCRPQRAWML